MHEEKNTITCQQHFPLLNQKTCVADPDLDPDVFGPPPAPNPDPLERDTDPDPAGSFYHQAKNSKNNLDSYRYCFVTSLRLLSLKNDVNVT
jgi:hypothetical protein